MRTLLTVLNVQPLLNKGPGDVAEDRRLDSQWQSECDAVQILMLTSQILHSIFVFFIRVSVFESVHSHKKYFLGVGNAKIL